MSGSGYQYGTCPDCGMQLGRGKGKHGLAWHNCSNSKVIERLEAENARFKKALEFYADPETYFAIAFFPDPPNGEFMEDFSDTGPELGSKPGKRAREALEREGEDV